ncbi:MAG TPA: N(4)-(beta-N-acetylglucosaminyl)-L-asparaginase [Candidatus Aminicenantes bacterium]|nr:N(4)-(beta-N-acetylglucosaminyl)-L-asparaginase [Candidatus Aminicenantes bacterium]HRY65704.1 N(4)-(beta-N-acetylglucosaminyl)-L-asparaginase [Candidatus Aminicenantes bacterium]HRZ72618.1 N(4)-(beta-N-acetylglucosaminyl)-L-asparaginase [Candidatus Aminicenantes bacterium]
MTIKMPRRKFVAGLAGLGVALPWLRRPAGASTAPGPLNRPLVVTSKTNAFVREAVTTAAWEELMRGGSALDAAIKGTNVSELDPRDASVGYGGDPNEEGFLQLDASVMNGPDGKAGAVAALENIKTPSIVARLVMERTDHLMLVGKGALKFAKMHGLKEEDLLTDTAREHWRDWKENLSDRDYYMPPVDKDKPEGGGTINVLVLDATGDIAGCTSTVGHRFKIVGRVGDSPIIGAGLYVDNAVGAAGATGQGEESIKTCASFLVVEKMREGMTPRDACRYVCQRVVDRHNGRPMFSLKVVALNKRGEYGSAAVRGRADKATGKTIGLDFGVHDARGHRMEAGVALLPPLTEAELKTIPWR